MSVLLLVGQAQAAAPVCSNTPGAGERIECTQGSTSTTAISLDVDGVAISTEDPDEDGIQATHAGTADITIDVTGTSTKNTISTAGASSPGIYGKHTGAGNVDIDVEDITITTTGDTSGGIHAEHSGTGDVDIDATAVGISTTGAWFLSPSGVSVEHKGTGNITIGIQGKAAGMHTTPSTITTTKDNISGIWIQQAPSTGKTGGNIAITLEDTQINTAGRSAYGVYAQQRGGLHGRGTLTATLNSGTTIATTGHGAIGVVLTHENRNPATSGDNVALTAGEVTVRTSGDRSHGLWVKREHGHGKVIINVDGSSITTEGNKAYGIYGYHVGDDNNGALTIDARNGSVTTGSVMQGGGVTTPKGYASYGIYAHHQNTVTTNRASTGDIRITTRNFDITTTSTADDPSASRSGTHAYGIYAVHRRSGNIVIDMQQGSSVTTAGTNSHGIVAYHYGDAASRIIDIMVRGPVTTSGTGAQGVRVGTITDGAPARVAARGANGFLQQTVKVNDAITSAAEGVYLAGGGKVVIGPSGAIRPDSGIAILATGDIGTPVIKPRLRVDLHPSGQRMTGEDGWLAQALGGGWILNDGGETTIAVNNVVLHEGASGVVANAVAPNGAWNVTMRAEGVNVSDYSSGDPMTWTKTEPATGIVLGRDFSADDFTEVRRLTPPPDPEPEPAPEPDPSPSDPDPDSSEPSGPMIIEDYAPRAALYEALPEFLLGLRTQTDSAAHRLSAALPLWLEVSGHSGEHDPQDSTVGTGYDTGHRVMTLGGTLVHNEHWNVQASVHRVSGSAEVSSAVKGGDIEAEGRGISLQARWSPGGGPYASGRIAWTDYALDLDSDDAAVGRLVSSVGAERLALQLEAGHRLPWGTRSFLTPQVGVSHTQVDIDGFTDATGARAAFRDAERSSARLGVRADTTTTAVALYGSVHLEHHLETGTTADVSGERLRARTPDHDLHLALGAQWQTGPWILQAGLGARHALGSDSHEYSGDLRVGVPF